MALDVKMTRQSQFCELLEVLLRLSEFNGDTGGVLLKTPLVFPVREV